MRNKQLDPAKEISGHHTNDDEITPSKKLLILVPERVKEGGCNPEGRRRGEEVRMAVFLVLYHVLPPYFLFSHKGL